MNKEQKDAVVHALERGQERALKDAMDYVKWSSLNKTQMKYSVVLMALSPTFMLQELAIAGIKQAEELLDIVGETENHPPEIERFTA